MSIRFHSAVLFTADIKRLSAFYIEVLGQNVQHDFGACVILQCGLSLWQPSDALTIAAKLGYCCHASGNKNLELCFETETFASDAVVPYDPQWPVLFEEEKDRLRSCLLSELIGRIEHFGSTAVPGLAAKPIVDMLVGVTDLEEVKQRVVPILESKGYDYFWRPTWGDGVPPWYAWFIRRNAEGIRTHHIRMVESHFEHWDKCPTWRFRSST